MYGVNNTFGTMAHFFSKNYSEKRFLIVKRITYKKLCFKKSLGNSCAPCHQEALVSFPATFEFVGSLLVAIRRTIQNARKENRNHIIIDD